MKEFNVKEQRIETAAFINRIVQCEVVRVLERAVRLAPFLPGQSRLHRCADRSWQQIGELLHRMT